MPPSTGIYTGAVVHRRLRPKSHLLRYNVFTLLLDLDGLDAISQDADLLAVNRFGLVSFQERDHGDGSRAGLRHWVDERLREAGVADPTSLSVRVLCYPRILGFVFNPLTVYFCETKDNRTVAILYEVNNTMGERHTYVIPVTGDPSPPLRQSCDKAMYVSPFTPMKGKYSFRVVPPMESVAVGIQQSDLDGPLLNASFTGSWEPLSNQSLRKALIRHPLMTLKVIAGIHVEAFKLWRKGIPFFKHEPQKRGGVSIVAPTVTDVGAD
jgi:DUF1365 family protein